MKKGLITMLIIAMVACIGLVSCKNEVEVPVVDDLVSISFSKDSSRALTASLQQGFVAGDYYWSYEAQKNDNSGLVSGVTGAFDETGDNATPVQSGKGLVDSTTNRPVEIPGFSKGFWNFRLFAFADGNRTQLVYWGKADNVPINENNHLVKVVVSPAATADGGYLQVGTIKFVPASTSSSLNENVLVTEDYLSKEVDDEWVIQGYTKDSSGKFSVPAGQYMFTRQYKVYDNVIASGSVIVTVYPYQTTEVMGSLNELTTYSVFGPEQNPDAVNVSASYANIFYNTGDIPAYNPADPTTAYQLTVDDDDQTVDKVEATISKTAANTLIADLTTTFAADDNDVAAININNTSTSMDLNLGVRTTATTATSVAYDISMTAEITYRPTGNTEDNIVKTADVTTVPEYVIVTVNMQPGITVTGVTHSGKVMKAVQDIDKAGTAQSTEQGAGVEEAVDGIFVGFYKYVAADNQLIIKTRSFSPFRVEYELPEVVAMAGGVQCKSLEEAFALQNDPEFAGGYTIVLQKDVVIEYHNADTSKYPEGGAYFLVKAGKKITLDLNGHSISTVALDNNNSALILNKGELTIIDSSDSDSAGTGNGIIIHSAKEPDPDDIPGYGNYTIDNYGTLNIYSGQISNKTTSGYATYPINASTGIVNIYGGLIKALQGFAIRQYIGSYAQSVAKENSWNEINVYGGEIANGIWVQNYKWHMWNGEVYDSSVVYNNGLLNIEGGHFTTGRYSLSIGYYGDYNNFKVVVSGGVFDGIIENEDDNYSAPSELIITGGSFTYDISDDCADDYFAKEIGGKYVVKPVSEAKEEDYVVSIGDVKYLKLSDALKALKAGDTLKILKNQERSGYIYNPVDGEITVDLNGKTVEFTGSYAVYSGCGKMTIRSTGAGGTITHDGGTSAIYAAAGEIVLGSNVTVTQTNNSAAWATRSGKITVDGAVVTTIAGERTSFVLEVDSESASIEVKAGNINSTSSEPIETYDLEKSVVELKGGSFNFEPDMAYVADGYKVVKDGSLWTVVPLTADDHVFISGENYSGDRYMTLATFRDSVNSGNTYAGCTVTLMRDVVLNNNEEWTPIGTASNPFSGVFDGNGKTITGLKLTGPVSGSALGLFGTVQGTVNSDFAIPVDANTEEADWTAVWNGSEQSIIETNIGETKYTAVVKNLTLSQVSVANDKENDGKPQRYTGALIGHAVNVYVSNITVSGNVYGRTNVGGLVGYADGVVIRDSKNHASVSASEYNVGGIVGQINGRVSALVDSVNYGTITCTGELSGTGGGLGGILGIAQESSGLLGLVSGCKNYGEIISKRPAQNIGGIGGQAYGMGLYVNCENSGNIITSSVDAKNVGGIVGTAVAKPGVFSCKNTVDLTVSAEVLAGIYTYNTENGGANGLCVDCLNSGVLVNQKDNCYTYQISDVTKEIKYTNTNYSSASDIQDLINAALVDNRIIVFESCTVTDATGSITVPAGKAIYSDVKLCNSVSVTGSEGSTVISIPEITVEVASDLSNVGLNVYRDNVVINIAKNSAIKSLYLTGTVFTVNNNGTVAGSINFGDGATGTVNNNYGASINGGIGSIAHTPCNITINNDGTISKNATGSGSSHTIDFDYSAHHVVINNHGTIENVGNSYVLLFYIGANLEYNAYSGSVLKKRDGNTSFIITNSTSTIAIRYVDGAKYVINGSEHAWSDYHSSSSITVSPM